MYIEENAWSITPIAHTHTDSHAHQYKQPCTLAFCSTHSPSHTHHVCITHRSVTHPSLCIVPYACLHAYVHVLVPYILLIFSRTHIHTHMDTQFKVLMVLVDAAVHIPTGLLWFASFSFTADQWRKTPDKDRIFTVLGINHGNAVVAFSFFCVLLWVSGGADSLGLLSRSKGGDEGKGGGGGHW